MSATTGKAMVTSFADQIGEHTVQDQFLIEAVSHQLSGATAISAGLCLMPPAHQSRAHLHERHEITVYVLEGRAATLWGWELEPIEHGPGDLVYIPAGVPHVAVNLSEQARLIAIEHRTDPAFNADVKLLPDLYEPATEIAIELRRQVQRRSAEAAH
jgi:uncharacterized RmlC-like cupin family protein